MFYSTELIRKIKVKKRKFVSEGIHQVEGLCGLKVL
jgi:hypothetical protein